MLPLKGFRVVEFAHAAAGPFCAMLLADLGAEVIKVEPPGGDMLRAWPPFVDGYSVYFASVNRNKRSVALDLKDARQREDATAIALSADAFVENFRPGALAKFGLDYATLSKLKPSLVYCSISAYGQTGPRVMEGGFDLSLQAMSGIMSVTGERDGRPAKCGVALVDFSTGLYGALSVVASLLQARATGKGEHIDVAMLGSALGISVLQTTELFGTGKDPSRSGSAHPLNAPYQAFRCKDGDLVIAAGANNLFALLCAVLKREDLPLDPRFLTTSLRAVNQKALAEILESGIHQVEHGLFVGKDPLGRYPLCSNQ